MSFHHFILLLYQLIDRLNLVMCAAWLVEYAFLRFLDLLSPVFDRERAVKSPD